MTAPARVVRGACLCGGVRFEVGLPTLYCAHCHCSLCQRSHGAGFVTWFTIPLSRLAIVEGEEKLVRYASSEHARRSFCGGCGSSLFFETTREPGRIDVVLANLDGAIDRAPEAHIFFDARAPWVEVEDGLPRLGGANGLEPLDP